MLASHHVQPDCFYPIMWTGRPILYNWYDKTVSYFIVFSTKAIICELKHTNSPAYLFCLLIGQLHVLTTVINSQPCSTSNFVTQETVIVKIS